MHGFFAGLVPRQVGQVDQAVDAAGQPQEHAEVGDRLDLSADLVALVVVHRELFPGIGAALLHAERNAAAVLVDLENHHLDFVAELDNLRGMHVLVGPVHLGHVDQTLYALFDFDKRAVVGQVGHPTEQAGALRVAARQADPGIFAQLLEAKRHTVLFLVELEHFCFDFIADIQHFGRMLDPAPGEVGDVQQAIDAAKVHERAVVRDVLDHTLDHRAFAQGLEQGVAIAEGRGFEHRAAGHHHVVALAVELDDLELHLLAFEGGGVLDRPDVDQRAGQEGTDAIDHDRQAALDLAADDARDQGVLLQRLVEIEPRSEALGLFARKLGRAVAVFDGVDRNLDEIADAHFELTAVVAELVDRNQALGLESGIHHHDVAFDGDNFRGDHLAGAHFLM